MGERWHITYDHWKDTAWRDSKNCREHFLTGWIFAHTLVIIYKCVDTFSLKRPKLTRFWTFFKKAVTNAVWATLTKQKLLGECTKWRLFINQNDERRNHFHAIKELNREWTNGVTCLMVENSDSYIPVIVHHNKNELIVEVGEQDKKIYRIGRNELNKTS